MLGYRYETGQLLLIVSEPRTIHVKLNFTPKQVWFSLQSVGQTKDSFDFYIVNCGFVIRAEMATESREIDWIAVF